MNRLEEKIRAELPFLGKQVAITGTSSEDQNGRKGTATSFDHTRERYVVKLDRNGETQKHKLLFENLTLHKSRRGAKKLEKTRKR